MKILICDDEAPARGELSFILESLDAGLELYEARNVAEARAHLIHHPDAIFLDINMPEESGLSFAADLLKRPNPPLIIFATAYSEHALKAFELAALDYVVKPFDEKRIAQTLKRIQELVKDKALLTEKMQSIQSYVHQQIEPSFGDDKDNLDSDDSQAEMIEGKIWAQQENDNRRLLDIQKDIFWFSVEEKRVYAHGFRDKLQVRYNLKELEDMTSGSSFGNSFVRVHKGILLNLNYIQEVVPWFSGNYMIRMKDEARSEVKMSRRYAAKLKQLTDWR